MPLLVSPFSARLRRKNSIHAVPVRRRPRAWWRSARLELARLAVAHPRRQLAARAKVSSRSAWGVGLVLPKHRPRWPSGAVTGSPTSARRRGTLSNARARGAACVRAWRVAGGRLPSGRRGQRRDPDERPSATRSHHSGTVFSRWVGAGDRTVDRPEGRAAVTGQTGASPPTDLQPTLRIAQGSGGSFHGVAKAKGRRGRTRPLHRGRPALLGPARTSCRRSDAELAEDFVRQYYRWVSPEGPGRAQQERPVRRRALPTSMFARRGAPAGRGEGAGRVYNPDPEP